MLDPRSITTLVRSTQLRELGGENVAKNGDAQYKEMIIKVA